jgi:hypothetical protein
LQHLQRNIENKSANHQVDDAVVLGAARVEAGEISANAAAIVPTG